MYSYTPSHWDFKLTVQDYEFLFIDFEGFRGLVVNPDQEITEDYLMALETAHTYFEYVESFALLKNAQRDWYHSLSAREYVNKENVMYHAARFLAQDSLTIPEWINVFVEDMKHNRPKFEPDPKPEKHLKSEKPGYVYLLKSEAGHYKIGRSVNPESRHKTFGIQLPFRVSYECLIKTENMKRLEAELHEKFAHKRLDGEWFDLSTEDIEYIKGIAS